jgi:hypothetical protein
MAQYQYVTNQLFVDDGQVVEVEADKLPMAALGGVRALQIAVDGEDETSAKRDLLDALPAMTTNRQTIIEEYG